MAITSREGARESEAMEVLAHTQVARGATWLLLGAFAALLGFVVVTQPLLGRPPKAAAAPAPAIEATAARPPAKAPKGVWQRLRNPPEAETLRRFERQLEEKTAIGRWVRPAMQRLLLRLHQGSGNVVTGQSNWLFYRKDVDHLLGHPFLAPDRLKLRGRREAEEGGRVQPDPVRSISAFAERLAARNVRLVVLPVPVKASIYPEDLSPATNAGVENASYGELLARLRAANVTVVDLLPALTRAKASGPELYSRRDTHWNAYGIAVAGQLLVPMLKPALAGTPSQAFTSELLKMPSPGDLDGLLNLPAPPELVTCNQVRDANGAPFQPKEGAPVALLGDSFSTVCTGPQIGGGFAAYLAHQLNVDVDLVASAGGGSSDSRIAFESQPARFANTRVVVWEFVTRSLTFGNWR